MCTHFVTLHPFSTFYMTHAWHDRQPQGFRQLFSWVAFDVDKNCRNPSPKAILSLSKICTHFAKLAPFIWPMLGMTDNLQDFLRTYCLGLHLTWAKIAEIHHRRIVIQTKSCTHFQAFDWTKALPSEATGSPRGRDCPRDGIAPATGSKNWSGWRRDT